MSISWYIILLVVKVDKVYLRTPTKIAILDHERKRTFVLRKDGLPDTGKFSSVVFSLLESYVMVARNF